MTRIFFIISRRFLTSNIADNSIRLKAEDNQVNWNRNFNPIEQKPKNID